MGNDGVVWLMHIVTSQNTHNITKHFYPFLGSTSLNMRGFPFPLFTDNLVLLALFSYHEAQILAQSAKSHTLSLSVTHTHKHKENQTDCLTSAEICFQTQILSKLADI